jgi:hypothetical protein
MQIDDEDIVQLSHLASKDHCIPSYYGELAGDAWSSPKIPVEAAA